MRNLLCLATLIASIGWATAAEAADWSVIAYREPFSSEPTVAASITNEDGLSVHIFRSGDHRVRWVLSLPEGTFDRLVRSGRIAAFRVDNLASSDIEVSSASFLIDLEQAKV